MFESNYYANNALAYLDYIDIAQVQVQSYRKCGKKHKFTCSKSMKISYCSKECSVQYWPYHKKLCKALQEIASEVD